MARRRRGDLPGEGRFARLARAHQATDGRSRQGRFNGFSRGWAGNHPCIFGAALRICKGNRGGGGTGYAAASLVFPSAQRGGGGGGVFAPAPSRPEGEEGADEVVDSPGKLALRAKLLAEADKHQRLDGGVPGNGFHDRPSVAKATR